MGILGVLVRRVGGETLTHAQLDLDRVDAGRMRIERHGDGTVEGVIGLHLVDAFGTAEPPDPDSNVRTIDVDAVGTFVAPTPCGLD